MSKITELPDELARRLPDLREKWLEIGLSKEPANRELAEKGIDLTYCATGHKPPSRKIWVPSPLEGVYLSNQYAESGEAGEFVQYKEWGRIKDRLGDLIAKQIDIKVEDQVAKWLFEYLKIQVSTNIQTQITTNLRNLLHVEDIRDRFWSSIAFGFRGQHSVSWLSQYKALLTIIKEIEILEGKWLLAQSCGWWWPFEDAAILSERPCRLMRNNLGLLHSEDGPALEYPDGFSIYAWHGYTLPENHRWIVGSKSRLTPEVIDAEQNAELRRIMLEIYGFENYLNCRPYRVLDEDVNLNEPRRLLLINVGNQSFKILDVYNGSLEPDGSRRRFFLGAHRKATTVHEAVAMSYGINAEFYREGLRT